MSNNSTPDESQVSDNLERYSIFEDIAVFSDNEHRHMYEKTDVTKEDIILNIMQNKYDDMLSQNGKGLTPLMYAIKHTEDKDRIIDAIIESENGQLPEIDDKKQTALIYAIKYDMEDVAIDILLTENSNYKQKDYKRHDALYYAKKEGLMDVIDVIQQKMGGLPQTVDPRYNKVSQMDVNINQTGYDIIEMADVTIKDFLAADLDNVVFVINQTPYLLNKSSIKKQLKDNVQLKYGCKEAGDTLEYSLDDNIEYKPIYFSLSSISPAQVVVKKDQIKSVLNSIRHRIFVAKNTNKILPSIISEAYLRGEAGTGADYCQNGKSRPVYELIKANAIDEPLETEVQETSEGNPHIVRVIYNKNNSEFEFPITLTTSLQDIKEMLLNKLIEQNKLKHKNFDIHFIYKNVVYTEDIFETILLKDLKNPPYGIKLKAGFREIIGGKRKKTQKRKKSKLRKTIKRNKKSNKD
jgi:hypothetical protein